MSQPTDIAQLDADLVVALDEASRTHPCTCGSTIWSSCFHSNVPTHSERRSAAVLAVVQPLLDAKDTEIARLREELAVLKPERPSPAQCHRFREHPGHLWFRNREPVRCPGFPLNPAPRET